MMRWKALAPFAAAVCLALFATTAAPAATITDLYNTGMATPWDAAVQTPLPGSDPGVAVDPHWDVTMPSSATLDTRTIDDSSPKFTGNQFSRYQLDLDDDPYAQSQGYTQVNDSQWIQPNVPATGTPGGVYAFTTTFTTTQPVSTIEISGFFKASDVLAIQLNSGPLVDPGSPHGAAGEHTPSRPPRPFTITGTGTTTNTLTFYVNNVGTNLAGLRVQFTSATFAVPEPSTICLSVLGLVGFGAVRLRRRFSRSK